MNPSKHITSERYQLAIYDFIAWISRAGNFICFRMENNDINRTRLSN